MALTTCKECGESVSTKANICPHCGVEDPSTGFWDFIGGIIFLGIIYVIFFK